MRNSSDHILTTQAGSLPRPADLIELNARRQAGEDVDEAAYQARLREATIEVVQHQVDLGIDVPGDGEFGKAMGAAVDYGAWWSYSYQRLGGLGMQADIDNLPHAPSARAKIQLDSFPNRRDRAKFSEAYNDPDSGIAMAGRGTRRTRPVAEGPVTYIGQEAIQRDIDNFRAALDAAGAEEGFMTSIAPGSAARIGNAFYKTEEEFIWACADAMREEYQAIVNAGFILQLDDPAIAENFDMVNPEPSIEDYLELTMIRVEALNYALRDIPQEMTRFHLCWGSWHGPHTTDIPMKDLVDTMLKIECGSYSFEAANVRHEHEWKVWLDGKLPEGKIIVPGIVSHATNVVEHPELVADRIERFANAVGKENVIAATDCGLGGRVHPQIGWAKLETLAQGAKLASERLY